MQILSTSIDKTTKIWNCESGACIHSFGNSIGCKLTNELVLISNFNKINLINVKTGDYLMSFESIVLRLFYQLKMLNLDLN